MIGAARFFGPRYFAPRYWPKVGDVAAVVEPAKTFLARARATLFLARSRPTTFDARED